MRNTITTFCDLLIRLSVGFMFANSGRGKIHNLDAFIEDFSSWNIPAAATTAPTAAWVEMIAGALLLGGIVVRIAASALALIMAGALINVVAPPIVDSATTWTGILSSLFYTPEWLLLIILISYALLGGQRFTAAYLLRYCRNKHNFRVREEA